MSAGLHQVYLTFANRRGLFLAQNGSVSRQELPPSHSGHLTVLLADHSAVVLLETIPESHRARLIVRRATKVTLLRELGRGSPLWQGNSTGGTHFLLAESARAAVTITISADGTIEHHRLDRIPHGVMCYDSAMTATQLLSTRAFETLERELSYLSSCLSTHNRRLVGVSTYLTTSPDAPEGQPSTAIAVADTAGHLIWSRTFNGDTYGLAVESSHNEDLMVANNGELEILDVTTGTEIARLSDATDGLYVAQRQVATISRAGQVKWLTY